MTTNAQLVGEALIKRSFSSANPLIAVTTILSVGALIWAYYSGWSNADLKTIVITIAFVLLLPIMVVSLALSASAREFLGIVGYTSRFNFGNELDAALSLYREETTTSRQQVLIVIYAVFWLLFFLASSNFIAILTIGSLFFRAQ